MTPFLLYIARSSLYLAVFYSFFLLVMRRTSLFSFNRFMLLAGTAACFALPLVRLRTAAAQAAAGPLEAVAAAAEPLQAASAARGPAPLLLLYVVGAAAVLVLTAFSVLRICRTFRSGSTTIEDGYRLTVVDSDLSSFSWGRHIVVSRSDLETYPAILTHERMHVRKFHSLDIAFFSVVTILHWFNPLVWITLSELKLLHEYEADDAVINQGIDATQYQLLMVKKAVGEKRFSLANGFQHSNLKNRIAMMIKPQTSGWMRLAYVAILPVIAVLMFACNPAREQQQEEPVPADQLGTKAAMDNEDSFPYAEIEVKPTFNGGDANEFSKWVAENLKYPEAVKASGAQGRVTLSFIVGADGSVSDVKVLRGINELLDAEAVRVISASPKWSPGSQGGKPVPVTYVFPVVFKLQ